MESDSDDEILLDNFALKFLLLKGKRECSVHDVNKKRKVLDFNGFNHLNYILENVLPYITVNWTNFNRIPIGVEERLVVTTRYLTTGASFRHLAFAFRMGRSTVANIVKEMTRKLWNVLQPIHTPVPTEATFRKNFPHCIGAIDGKHIKIKAAKHSGSVYFNCKHHFSIVLQGVCDANYKLIMIDVGGYGKHSDGGTFQNSAMYKLMHQKKLKIPDPDCLPETTTVCVTPNLRNCRFHVLSNFLPNS
nr:unnamed protein product [Callosobruchus chinensis]